jgi:hypothetical protein
MTLPAVASSDLDRVTGGEPIGQMEAAGTRASKAAGYWTGYYSQSPIVSKIVGRGLVGIPCLVGAVGGYVAGAAWEGARELVGRPGGGYAQDPAGYPAEMYPGP